MRGAWHQWRSCFEEAARAGAVPEVKQKVFKPKFPEIPVLEDYKAGGDQEFWSKFPANMS